MRRLKRCPLTSSASNEEGTIRRLLHPELTKAAQHGTRQHVVITARVIWNLLAFKCGLWAAGAWRARRAFIVAATSVAFRCRTGGAYRRDDLGFQHVKILLAGWNLTGGNSLIAAVAVVVAVDVAVATSIIRRIF